MAVGDHAGAGNRIEDEIGRQALVGWVNVGRSVQQRIETRAVETVDPGVADQDDRNPRAPKRANAFCARAFCSTSNSQRSPRC